MDDFLQGVGFVSFFIFVCVSVVNLSIDSFGDYREYSRIYRQCRDQGFIQDHTSRISCSIETAKPKKKNESDN